MPMLPGDLGAVPPISGAYKPTAPRSSPPLWTPPPLAIRGKPFPTGARPTPPHLLRDCPRATLAGAPPEDFAVVPGRLDYWGNNEYGVCVTSEEAFAKACYAPEIFVDAEVVIAWARRHNVLNGATLEEVLQAFIDDGFQVATQRYNDGRASVIDHTSEEQLKLALTKGPVKIAIDSRALPGAAGNEQGWWKTGGRPNQYRNTDHCVSLSGYGSAEYLYGQLGVQLPAGLPAATRGYMLFTWSTLGFVDFAWLQSTCVEAWLRQPTTVGVPPLPAPGPDPTDPDIWKWEHVWSALGYALHLHIGIHRAEARPAAVGVDVWNLVRDVWALGAAIRRRDWPAAYNAAAAILADLGWVLPAAQEEAIRRAVDAAGGKTRSGGY